MKGEEESFSKEPEFIKEMFNSISANYDKLNDIMTFGMHKRIKKDIINQLPFTLHSSLFTVLDLCTGTGDLAGILKRKYPKAKVIGVDFSSEMLDIARQKHPDVEFIEADCTNLPFEDESFDLCVISFGLRNIEDMQKAISEIYRVLKTGGVFVNIDLGKPNKFVNLFLKPYMHFWVALMGKFFHGDETPYKYLAQSNETFPSQYELIENYKNIGFSQIKNINYVFGQIAAQISVK